MQYLKEETRKRIMASALIEFRTEGYSSASVRRIARNAGVASGSVYIYYANKQALFNDLVGSVYEQLMSSINDINKIDFKEIKEYFSPDLKDESYYAIKETVGTLLDICKDHNRELYILMEKSKGVGNAYESTKDDLISLLDAILQAKLLPNLTADGVDVRNDYIAHILSACFIEGFCSSLREYENGSEVKLLMDQLINILFKDIAARF
jgi:AcrR family transcriptional regulator